MKKSKKYKKWKAQQKLIKKNNKKPLLERWMGNVKINCYSCCFAGLYFNENNCRYEPFCFYNAHQGKIANISYTKWNDNVDLREKAYCNRYEAMSCAS